MAHSQLTPRQKMINMLYLVLTAILALNVSSEVLDAFKTVNDGISISNTSQLSKNSSAFTALSRQYAIDSLRAKEAYTRAEQARALSAKLNNLLEQYKQQMIKEAGGIDAETGKIKRDDDINIATHLFVENANNGRELKKQITETRVQLLALLSEADKRDAEKSLALKIDEPANGSAWEYAKFNNVPVVAAVTLLTKYQNDVLNAEGHVVDKLYNSVNDGTKIVDQMAAKIISPSSYILQGEAYRADVMVAASSSTLVPEVFLGAFTSAVKRLPNSTEYAFISSKSDALPLVNPVKVDVQNGLGKLALGAAATGNRKYTGVVRIKNSGTGDYEFYPFEGEYQVAPKMAVVSPRMMNVLYIGLDNPIDVSVPGVAQSNISASLEGNGTLVKSADGSYNARVTKNPKPVKVTVRAKVNGKDMEMGIHEFRVKRVPDPISTLDGVYEGGRITLAKMKATTGVVPLLKNFEYPARYTVVGYDVIYKSKKDGSVSMPIAVQGPLYNQQVKDILAKRMEPGDGFFIDNIIVKDPGGENRKIPPIAFDITNR